MNLRGVLADLKRRGIYQVAGGYAVVAWSLIQIATQLFAVFDLPQCALRWAVVLLVFAGLPMAVILAMILDIAERMRPNEWSRVVLTIGLIAAGTVALRQVESIDETRQAATNSRAPCHHAG